MDKKVVLLLILTLLIANGCSDSGSISSSTPIGEYLYRRHDQALIEMEPMDSLKRPAYPWEEDRPCNYPKITKDFFRCQGSQLNPSIVLQKGKETVRYHDCGGAQKHSLPLRNEKEFIYPILIDLLNYIQKETGKRVVITCGHCCPDHNSYLDPSPSNQTSKHMLGAEVDFYILGMEQQPYTAIDLIFKYYQEQPKYKGLKEYQVFKRYEKANLNVSTPPWYNKEIFVKLALKTEGRDCDNRHLYPYITIQVRYDSDLRQPVTYSWDKAFRNLHRW